MRKILLLLGFIAFVFSVRAQVTVTNPTNTTPGLSATYASLALAITDLNAQTAISGPVIIALAGNETAPVGGYSITANPTGVSAVNSITIQGSSSTITAFTPQAAGALNDAIFKIIGSDYVTIQNFTMQENTANTTTTALTNNMTEFGVALFYVSTTDGAQNNTIQNNTISLNRTYQNTFGIYSNSTHTSTTVTTAVTATGSSGGNNGLKIFGNAINNINNGIVIIGPTAAADANTGIDIGGSSLLQGNTITNYGTTGTFSSYINVSTTVNGILIRNSNGFNCSYNTVTSSVGGVTVGTLNGIQVPAASATPTTTFTNNINYNSISLKSGLATGAMNGINYLAGSASTTSTLNINNNDFNNWGHTVTASGIIIFILTASTNLNTEINNNTFTNLSVNTTGNITFISQTFSLTLTGGTKTVSGNSIVTSFNKTGVGGTVLLITDNGSSTTVAQSNCTNNNFSNITVTGATVLTGLNYTDGGAAPSRTVSGNTLSNWTGGTSAINCMNFTYWSGTASLLSTNTISNITGQGVITGITIGSSANTANPASILNNIINGLSSTGTGGAVTGILCSNTSTLVNISSNTINTLSSTGASAVIGISITGATTTNVYKNKVYDLSGSNASTTVSGISISGGTTINVHNNLVGDLRVTVANAANPLIGLNITGGTTVNAYYNTIYLNGTSSGTNFGSSAVSASTTPTVTLRNNIFYNTSSPNGTGLAVAYRRSSTTLTTYGSTSNSNNFYGTTIYTDGTNTEATIGGYKTRVSSRGDAASFYEDPEFQSVAGANANFLKYKVSSAKQIESGAVNISTYTTDYFGTVRQGNPSYAGTGTAPDIGAWELEGIGLDLAPPTITYTTLNNTIVGANQTLTATISDGSGVGTGAGLPTLYWKLNAGSYTAVTGTSIGGNQYTFTFGNATTTIGDVISYYIVAQDAVGTPNVGAFPSTGAAGFSIDPPTASTPPTTPSTFTALGTLSGNKTVGSGGDYATLKAAFDDINANVVIGDLNILILTGGTSETAVAQLNPVIYSGAAHWDITVKPDAGVTATIVSNQATPIILNGADYVIFDGSNNGTTSKDLTISSTNVSITSAVIWIQTTTLIDAATNNTVKNCNVIGNSNTTTLFGIGSGSTTISTSSLGTGNNSNVFSNNTISKVQYGIFSQGASLASKNTGTVISNNLLNTTGSNAIGRGAIVGGFEDGISVTGNTIDEITFSNNGDVFGIALGGIVVSTTTFTGNEVVNATVKENKIGTVTHTGTYSAIGILLSSATSGTSLIANNVISGVGSNGTGGDFASGIFVGGGVGSTTNIYHNSISMTGTFSGGAYPMVGISVGGSNPIVNIKNNLIQNTQVNGTGNSIAIALAYSSPFTNLTSDYNDFFTTTGATFYVGSTGSIYAGTTSTNIANWRTATSKDANSVSVIPDFTSATDLTPTAYGFPGIPIGGIATDYNGATRNTSYPSMGAYEANLIYGSWKVAASSSVWETNTNWVGDAGPISTVIIPSGASNMPTLASSPTVNRLFNDGSITIDGVNTLSVSGNISNTGQITGSTAGLTLNGTAAQTVTLGSINIQNFTLNNATGATLIGSGFLNVTGTVNITAGVLASAGRLTLKSTATTNARVATVASGAITGNVNVEKYLSGKRAYRFLGHPFNASIALSQLMTTNGANTGLDVTGTGGATNGFTTTVTNNPSAFSYTPASGNSTTNPDPGWSAITSASATNWAAKQGLRVFVRGTKGEGLNGAAYVPSATTVTMTGTLNDGSAPVFTLTNGTNSDYNLIANPLASTIDMSGLTLGGDVAGSTFYVWDVSQGTAGAYVNEPFASAATYRYLPLGSAFFARSASGGTITFSEAAKVSNTPASILRGTSKYGDNSIQLVLNDNTGVKHDRILFFFNKKAVEEKDNMDGEKMTNPGVNFFANSKDSKKLSIDVRPLTENSIIPLTLNTPLDKEFTITAEDFNITDNKDVLLHDKKTDIYTKLSAGATYSFTSTLSDATTYGDRFELVMKINPMLLVENTLDIKLSPNPVKDVLTINYATPANTESSTIIKITNNVGQIVEHLNFGISATGSIKVNMSKYAKGIYIVELVVGKEKIVKQIVKQ